jgi:hypothetical protein
MAANAASKQRRRGPGRPFQAGRSGNPAGKPKGTRHEITLLAEQIMADDAEAVVVEVIKAAKGGDMTAARLILDRIAPPRRGQAVAITLPDVKSPRDVTDALAAIITAMGSGSITTEEAAAIAAVVEMQRRAIETVELEARMSAVEEAMKSNDPNN